ncbi:MAG: holo-ACP synthase [Candidatus Binatia bacterium]
MNSKIGIDLVEIIKVQKLFEDREVLQETVFTPKEVCYSMRQRYPFIHVAACFAVKEAFFKALGTGLSGEMDWRDVEVQKEESGKAILRVWGKTAQVAHGMGVAGYTFSMSHAGEYAVALVLLILRE